MAVAVHSGPIEISYRLAVVAVAAELRLYFQPDQTDYSSLVAIAIVCYYYLCQKYHHLADFVVAAAVVAAELQKSNLTVAVAGLEFHYPAVG